MSSRIAKPAKPGKPATPATPTTAAPLIRRIGLISDTHNLVRPEALQYLAGCDAIIHAGDICRREVLDALTQIAPVTAVRGNNDTEGWVASLPAQVTLTVQQVTILVVHDIADVSADPRGAGIGVVVTGHSHKPSVSERDGVLFVNPGSAGPRRFKLPVSAGMLLIDGSKASARFDSLLS
ncbi:metallophosphatase family protein [Paraburkholderia sp. D15]|uniref:metallophosphoesterase family protein n=1 Tax=Paraburkholderia sp. D15 TaxID=2880218 RepID=UPI002478CA46|nr:metallophosphoesterase family protein [Paraburkholderia sp. D15]WGS48625.1 metallophosphatase family protein [Paraburkholderia sp. D15]